MHSNKLHIGDTLALSLSASSSVRGSQFTTTKSIKRKFYWQMRRRDFIRSHRNVLQIGIVAEHTIRTEFQFEYVSHEIGQLTKCWSRAAPILFCVMAKEHKEPVDQTECKHSEATVRSGISLSKCVFLLVHLLSACPQVYVIQYDACIQ